MRAESERAESRRAWTRERLAAGGDFALGPLARIAEQSARVLAQSADDLSREFGDAVYDEMLRDPAVCAAVDVLKSQVLSEPLRVVSRVQDRQSAEYGEARRCAEFVDRQIDGMRRSARQALWETLEAVHYGSSLAEVVYEEAEEDGRPILQLADIRTRKRSSYGIVVDASGNVIGAVPREAAALPLDPERIVPRRKLMILTFQPRVGDPRGTSLLRAAYNAYYTKSQLYPQYLKFLVQFASPSLVGYTPEGALDEVQVLDENGNPQLNPDGTVKTITPERDMLETLLGFQSGTVAVLRGGSRLDVIQSQGGGEAFARAVELLDRQIAMAILKSPRTLLEAQHSSKADSESAQDITDVFVSTLRQTVSEAFERDVVRPLVALNFGAQYAERYAPSVTLNAAPRQDFAKSADAITRLWTAGYLHWSQVAETDALIGLPERDVDAFLAELEDRRAADAADRLERLKLLNPGAAARERDIVQELGDE